MGSEAAGPSGVQGRALGWLRMRESDGASLINLRGSIGFRPAAQGFGEDLVDQEAGLVEGVLSACGQGAEDEFLGAGFDVLGEAGEDGGGVADGEVVVGVLAGALGVGGFEAGQGGV